MRIETLPRLRRFQADDAPFLERLAAREFDEYTPGAGLRTLGMARRKSSVALVATYADQPIGFAIVDFRQHGSALDAIAVAMAHRGRGVGRTLLARAELEARARRATELRLVTAEANLAALDLFLRSGFTIAGRLGRYYPRGQDAVAMTKTLV